MNNEHDDLLLQRLVDGELSEQQQQEILAKADDEPAQWRRLALAFVETQIWANEYRTAAPADCAAGTPQSPKEPTTARERSPRSSNSTTRGILVLTASLLLAWGIGLWQGGLRHSRSPVTPVASQTRPETEMAPAKTSEIVAEPEATEVQPPVLRLTLDDTHSGQVETVDVPLDAFDDGYLHQPPHIGDDVRRILGASGYRVNQQRQVVPVRFANGQPGVLPVNRVNLKYEGLDMYQ